MNRLRAYRDIEGLNQQELGDILGLSPQMVSAIEAGRREFSGDLSLLGYAAERMELPDMSEPLHRQRATTSATANKRAKELLRLAGEVYAALIRCTENAPNRRIARHDAPQTLDALEDLAIDVRSELDHEEFGPIRNLTAAVERAGVCLVPIVGLAGIDGISAWVDGIPVIGLSPNVPGDRFRFSLSHELGHLLFHHRPGATAEGEANRFAGALLFPRVEFEAAMPDRPQLRDFIALKASWGMPVAALVYRAHYLDFVDDSRYRALQIQMSKWHKTEPASFDPVRGNLLGRLVEVNGGIDSVSEKLGINRRHIHDVTNWSHLRRRVTTWPWPHGGRSRIAFRP